MQNVELARFNMIEQQIRPCEVLDMRILDLLKQVRRELYVPAACEQMAFVDMELPLGHGQFMWQPKLEARVLQELNIARTDSVLEIGTGSGYLTALLAALAHHVTSVEINPALAEQAKKRLAQNTKNNITLEVGDAAQGWGTGKYDVIVMTGSTPALPENIQEQLNEGGRLFAIVGEAPVMSAQITTRVARYGFETQKFMEVCVPELINAKQTQKFVF